MHKKPKRLQNITCNKKALAIIGVTSKKLYVNLSSNCGPVQHCTLILAATVAQSNTVH